MDKEEVFCSFLVIAVLGGGVLGMKKLMNWVDTKQELSRRRTETFAQTDARHLPFGGPFYIWDPNSAGEEVCFAMMKDFASERVGKSSVSGAVHSGMTVPCTDKIRQEARARRAKINEEYGIKADQDPSVP